MNRRVKIIIAGALAVLVAGTAVWYGYFNKPAAVKGLPFGQAAPAEATLTAARGDAAGVDPATTFRLTTAKAVSVESVRKQMTVFPAVDVRVEKADLLGREFKITPAKPLETGRIYRFRLAGGESLSRPYQWSFQTKAVFRVLGTLPRNQATGVPVNTGIEVTFSADNYADIDRFFTITPAVEGRFERHKKTVAFVPKNPLEPGTVYTVTVKQGLTQTDSDGKLTEDFTFAFETQPEEPQAKGAWFYIDQGVQDFMAADAPYFQVGYDPYAGGAKVDVKVFRYKDAAGFIAALSTIEKVPWWASYNRNKFAEDVSGLAQAMSFSSELKAFPNYPGAYLIFPDKLPGGYYVGQVTLGDQTRQVHFQVTDLASYVAVTSTKTLVWLHDLSSREPVKDAEIAFVPAVSSAVPSAVPGATTGTASGAATGAAAARTDGDGVAALVTPADLAKADNHAGAFLIAKAGSGATAKEAVVDAFPSWYYGAYSDRMSHYWRYIYSDRGLYKPDDVVNVFGVLQPRDQAVQPIGQVTVQAIRYDYRAGDDQPVPLAKAELPVQDGLYTGSIKLQGLKPGSYSLEARVGDSIVASTWFEVQTYAKPAYQLTVTPSTEALFAGDTMTFQVQAAFFEGTPVPGLQFQSNINFARSGIPELTTDDNGLATITYTPEYGEMYTGYSGPQWAYLNIHATTAEVGDITATSHAVVFPHTYYMTTSGEGSGTEATVAATLNQVVLDKVRAGAELWQNANWLGDPVYGAIMKGSIEEQNWIQEDDGEYYDFINKVVVKRYRYRPDPKVVGTFSAATDAKGQITYTFPTKKDTPYKVTFTVQDSRGHTLQSEAWVYGSAYGYRYGNGYHYYSLDSLDRKYQWRMDENAAFAIQDNGAAIPDRAKSFLFLTARWGLQSFHVQDSATYMARLQPGDLPNTNVAGVYFDGRQYHYAGEREFGVDPKEKTLKVTVTPDKESYRPGDTVTLAVAVTDKNGRPTQARVNLNLVDEALYALRDQNVNLVNSLYADRVPSGILRWNASHKVPSPGGGAEKGGDGGGVRADFRDAIFFETVATDAAGKATASFKVPDNLTAWRLTYQAINTGTMEAASGTLPVKVKLPFFVDLVQPPSYLTNDKPSVVVRSYGTALTKGQNVVFVATLEGPTGEPQVFKREGPAFTPVTVELPKLQPGAYRLTVRGTTNDFLTDAMALPFSVADSYLTQTQVDFYTLSPETKVVGADKGPTMLTFTDYDRSRYLRLLWQLSWQWGNRLEQKLARTEATKLLKQYFDQTAYAETSGLDVMAYQTEQGSVAILPYSDGELRLSALAADLAATRFDRAGLLTYFQTVLDDPQQSREQVALGLYGMAALDEPVLPGIQALLQQKGLTLNERLYLGLALARSGDLESARPLFYGILQEFGEQLGDNARVNGGSDEADILQATALTASLAAKLGEPQATALIGYLTENGSPEVLVAMEELLALQAGLPNLAAKAPAAFTYSVDGGEQRQQLKPGQSVTLALQPDSLASLQFKNVEGRVGVTATYPAPLKAADVKPTPGFSVSMVDTTLRTGESGGYKVGDIIRFTVSYSIPPTASDGAYEVSVYLPAGLRLVEKPWAYGASTVWWGWPLEVNGQKVTFYASKDGKPFDFFARAVIPGEYAAEQATIQFQKTGRVYALSPRWWARIGP